MGDSHHAPGSWPWWCGARCGPGWVITASTPRQARLACLRALLSKSLDAVTFNLYLDSYLPTDFTFLLTNCGTFAFYLRTFTCEFVLPEDWTEGGETREYFSLIFSLFFIDILPIFFTQLYILYPYVNRTILFFLLWFQPALFYVFKSVIQRSIHYCFVRVIFKAVAPFWSHLLIHSYISLLCIFLFLCQNLCQKFMLSYVKIRFNTLTLYCTSCSFPFVHCLLSSLPFRKFIRDNLSGSYRLRTHRILPYKYTPDPTVYVHMYILYTTYV